MKCNNFDGNLVKMWRHFLNLSTLTLARDDVHSKFHVGCVAFSMATALGNLYFNSDRQNQPNNGIINDRPLPPGGLLL